MTQKEFIQSKTPICDFLRDYASSGISRFHMPGHKGRLPDPAAPGSDRFSPYALDITEISGADSLYEADGIILESERIASELFGSAATFYSVEGSSQCIRAMLALAAKFDCRGRGSADCSERPIILAARNVHRSFITACALLDLEVEWLFPERSAAHAFYSCPISADTVRRRLREMKRRPAALYITSPDYLGYIQDISALSEAAHEFGIPLLADNAHGAYLHFLETPVHPMDLGADMCCDSAHKSLPALTGCAYLHIGKEAPQEYSDNARQALAMFGSTSPSYLLLSSLDRVNSILSGEWRTHLQECINHITECRQTLYGSGWDVIGVSGRNPFSSSVSGYLDFEPLKITIRTSSSGISGNKAADLMRKSGIECEFCDPDFIIMMAAPNNSSRDFDNLIKSMKAVQESHSSSEFCSSAADRNACAVLPRLSFSPPAEILSIRIAAFSDSCLISTEKAVGMVCADTAITCPPAVPIVVCGEEISDDAVKIMKYYHIDRIRVCRKKEGHFSSPL